MVIVVVAESASADVLTGKRKRGSRRGAKASRLKLVRLRVGRWRVGGLRLVRGLVGVSGLRNLGITLGRVRPEQNGGGLEAFLLVGSRLVRGWTVGWAAREAAPHRRRKLGKHADADDRRNGAARKNARDLGFW